MTEEREGFFPYSYYHVGLVVPDFEAALAELGPALGLTFNTPHTSVYGGETIKVAYARQGPPYFELIQGSPGGQWDVSAGPRTMDHVGYFSYDLDADSAALESAGMGIDIDGRRHGARFTYHRAAGLGMRIELVDVARYDELMERIKG